MMKHFRYLILVICGSLIFEPCAAVNAQTLPGEPAPSSASDSRHLSTEDVQDQGIKWAKFGIQPDSGVPIDVAIAAISIGYPPAGIALGFIKGLITAGGADPVGEALKAINLHLSEIDHRLDNLEKEVKAVRNQQFQDENLARIRHLRLLGKNVQDGNDQLRQWPTSTFEKTTIANQAGTTAALFLDDPDLWKWSDLHLYTNEQGQPMPPDMLPADFKPLPTFEYYTSALVLWMGALEYASAGDPSYVTGNRTLVNNLLKHAAFLSVRPPWRELESDAPDTLPEEIIQRVNCYIEPVSKYPTNGVCNARRVCDDVMRRTKRVVDSTQFTIASNNGMCTLSQRASKVSEQQEQVRWTEAERNPLYGSRAMALWEQWRTPLVISQEDALEQEYGVQPMTLLADKLEHLARFGTTREQFIGTFDPTKYTQEFVYAVKPNGELLWFRHLLGTRSKSEPGSRDPRLQVTGGFTKDQAAAPVRQISPANKATATGGVVRRPTSLGTVTSAANNTGVVPPASSEQFTHFWEGPKLVGNGWQQFRDVIPAGLSGIYGLTQNGVLKWYSHDGFNDGTMKFRGPVDVGSGWNSFVKIVPAGDGIVYGIDSNGILKWYKHGGYLDGSVKNSWSGPTNVGSGWSNFKDVFSGGEGIIYAVTQDGILKWYHHRGYMTGAVDWEGPKDVATGWQNFKRIFSPGDGMIYALKPNGDLLWYKHSGYKDGRVAWQGPVEVATGLGDFVFVFPRMVGTWTPPVR